MFFRPFEDVRSGMPTYDPFATVVRRMRPYIRSSMEEEKEEEEDKALLETCIEASCTPTRSPRQIDKKTFHISALK